jgi:hypothetical protein
MNNLKRLEFYVTAAMAKARLKPHGQISAMLAEAMPEVIQELRRIATAPDSDMVSRKFAIATLESFWRTLLTTSLSDGRTVVKRAAIKVRGHRVKVAEQQAALRVHELRAAADKKLESLGAPE